MPTAERPTATPSPRASKATEVAFRVLEQLERLDDQHSGSSLAGLASRLDMKEETLRPYLNRLVERGKIYRDGIDRLYYLDPDCAPVRPTRAAPEKVQRVLEQYVADTGHEVALAVLTTAGLRLPIYVKSTEGPTFLANLREDSAHATAAGRALLSGRTTSYVRRYFTRVGMPAFTDATVISVDVLLPLLVPGSRGVWNARGQYCDEGACLAVIAHDSRFTAMRFALTTSLEQARFHLERQRLQNRLLQSAGELQPFLGPLDA